MATQEKFSGLSIASLITGILALAPFNFACAIAGIVCGAIDLARIKSGKSSKKSRGMDLAGIILGAVGIVLSIVLMSVGAIIGLRYLPQGAF